MNFRLNFHTSAPTTLEPYEIIANIQFELKDKKYNVAHLTNNSVTFKDNRLRFRSSWSPTMLDGGEFVISNKPDGERLVTLHYYWNFFPFLFFITAITIVSVFQNDYFGLAFFGIFFGIVILVDIVTHKGKASELIADVLQTGT